MTREQIRPFLKCTLAGTHFTDLGSFYRGKVRDTYVAGNRIILVTTDRISAFDHILRQTIPFKGQVLNQLAAFQFNRTQDVIENHVISVPDPNVTIARRCDAIEVEFVVRGYLAGHAWRTYASGSRVLCGERLPDGLRENSKLPVPILTPATKASEGHDEDISVADIISKGILDMETVESLKETALRLFERGTSIAAEHGLILVDTKYEFGRTVDGQLILIDEIHTPDSSRYFYGDTYAALLEENQPQRQLSKEFVREWLMAHDFQGLEGQILPDLDDEFVIELFEKVTGTEFIPDLHHDPESRVRDVLASENVG
jgi:phosphoribosylaminoimidazole-succinocarboxamide synthase